MLTLLALLLAVSLTAFAGFCILQPDVRPLREARRPDWRIYTALAIPALVVTLVVFTVLRKADPEDAREIIRGAWLDVWTGEAH